MGILSERLRAARASRRLSQTEVMRITQINNKTLSGYENSVSEPDFNTLLTLAKLYGVSTDYLLGQTDNPQGIQEKKQTPADIAGENVGEVATENALAFITEAAGITELTDILRIENKVTYMGVPMTDDDIIRTRHVIEMVVMHSKLPKIIPIYPPRPPRDYSKIAKIEDIDPDQVPLPAEFMYKDQRITRYVLQAEGRIPTDDDWKEIVRNYKFNPPE